MARKLIYYVATTVDGFIARSDGSFDCFLFEGEHFRDLIAEFPETFPVHLRQLLGIGDEVRHFDTVLMGRATYEVGLREGVTNPYSPLRQYVFTTTIQKSLDPGVEVFAGDPVDLVRRLKAEATGKDIWLCGGGKLAAKLCDEIDELILKINPVAIGTGIPLFHGMAFTMPLELLDRRVYSNGFVFARYAVRRQSITGQE